MPARAYMDQLATQSTRILALNQPAGLPDAGRGDVEPLLRPAEAAVARPRCGCCSSGVLLARADLDGPAVQRGDERGLLPFDATLSEKLMLGRVIREISRFALVKVDQGSPTRCRSTGWCRR